MQGRATLKRHAALVDRMATALGVDLEEATLRGEMAFDDLADAVLRCTGCAAPCACDRWLDALQVPADAPPDFCRNAQLLTGLVAAAHRR